MTVVLTWQVGRKARRKEGRMEGTNEGINEGRKNKSKEAKRKKERKEKERGTTISLSRDNQTLLVGTGCRCLFCLN